MHLIFTSVCLFFNSIYDFFFLTAPKLKGRPRKRKKIKRPGSPESVSSSESSASTSHSVSTQASTKVCTVDILFSSNHNIHKSSHGLCFWASDPLIDKFYKNLAI